MVKFGSFVCKRFIVHVPQFEVAVVVFIYLDSFMWISMLEKTRKIKKFQRLNLFCVFLSCFYFSWSTSLLQVIFVPISNIFPEINISKQVYIVSESHQPMNTAIDQFPCDVVFRCYPFCTSCQVLRCVNFHFLGILIRIFPILDFNLISRIEQKVNFAATKKQFLDFNWIFFSN